MEEFLASDMEKVTGVKRTRWVQWRERGWLSDPTVQVAEGHGTRNIWDRHDLYTICLFRNITEIGLPRKVAAHIAEQFVPIQRAEYEIIPVAVDPNSSEYTDHTDFWSGEHRKDYWEHFRYLSYVIKGNKGWGVLSFEPEINLEQLIPEDKLKSLRDIDRLAGREDSYKDFPSEFDVVLTFDLQKIKREVDEKIEELKG